jgi:hypothetical protein
MKLNNTIDQLRTLNELFVRTGESDPDNAVHIRRVLDFFSESQYRSDFSLSLSEGAERLARLHFGPGQEQKLYFAHWDVPHDEQFSPLWIRQALIARMKHMVGTRAAFLLITGLREAICPEGSYWTRKRQEYYDQVCNYINDLFCSWVTQRTHLSIAIM